jgi:hypothetical protein
MAAKKKYFTEEERLLARRETYKKYDQKRKNKKKEWHKFNEERLKEYHKNYKLKNKKKRNEQIKRRLEIDIGFKISRNLRSRLNLAIKTNQKSGSAVHDLGCSIPELKIYLESKFQEGMSWDNWSFTGWHIDHIVPLDSFDLTNREEFLKACHYTNLQPMWAEENLKKNNRIL